MKTYFAVLLMMGLMVGAPTLAVAKVVDDFYVNFPNTQLMCVPNAPTPAPESPYASDPALKPVALKPAAKDLTCSVYANGMLLNDDSDFQSKKVGERLYHLRRTTWGSKYWEVDFEAGTIMKTEGVFGVPGEGAKVAPEGVTVSASMPDSEQEGGAETFIIEFRTASLIFKRSTEEFLFVGGGQVLMNNSSMEMAPLAVNIYHFKAKGMTETFMKIYTDQGIVTEVTDGMFGLYGGREAPLSLKAEPFPE